MEAIAVGTVTDEEMAMLTRMKAEPGFMMPCQAPVILPAEQAQPESMETVYQGFVVEDMKAADWACRKVARYMELKKQIDDYVKEEIARLKEYQARMDSEYDDHINFLTAKLQPFAEAQIEGTKKKSFRLPGGNLQFRTNYDVTKDDEKLMAYVKETCPEYIKVEESVKWGDFKKQLTWTPKGVAVTPDGEVLDFISRTEKKSFKVEI